MKKLIVILSFIALLGCATTQPNVAYKHEEQKEETLPKKTPGQAFWDFIDLINVGVGFSPLF